MHIRPSGVSPNQTEPIYVHLQVHSSSFYIDNKFFPSTNIIFNNPIGYVSLPSIESEPAGLEALLIAHTPKQLQVSCAYILPVESLDINE